MIKIPQTVKETLNTIGGILVVLMFICAIVLSIKNGEWGTIAILCGLPLLLIISLFLMVLAVGYAIGHSRTAESKMFTNADNFPYMEEDVPCIFYTNKVREYNKYFEGAIRDSGEGPWVDFEWMSPQQVETFNEEVASKTGIVIDMETRKTCKVTI